MFRLLPTRPLTWSTLFTPTSSGFGLVSAGKSCCPETILHPQHGRRYTNPVFLKSQANCIVVFAPSSYTQ